MRQGDNALWGRQWESAIAAYSSALEEFPEDPKGLDSLGLAWLQSGEPQEALRVYQRAALLDPTDFISLERTGEILERLSRTDEAARSFLAAGEFHLGQGEGTRAAADLARASRLAPNHLAVHSRLALAYERSGRGTEAIPEYLILARILQRAGQPEKSLQAINRALQIDPQNSQASQALQMLKSGQPLPELRPQHGDTRPLALDSAHLFLPPEPETPSANGRLRESSLNPAEGARSAAWKALSNLLLEPVEGPYWEPAVQLTLARAIDYVARNEQQEALEALFQSFNGGVDHPALHFGLALLLVDLDRSEEAIRNLEQAAHGPDYAMAAYFAMGEVYTRLEQYGRAAASYLEALKLADLSTVGPERADALGQAYEALLESFSLQQDPAREKKVAGDLSRFLSGEGWEDRLAKAREQLDTQAGEESRLIPMAEMLSVGGSERIVESLALIDQYLRKGSTLAAMEEAYRALGLAPAHLPIHLRMAEILLREGRHPAAIAKYESIAETYRVRDNSAQAARILEKVVRLAPMDLGARARLVSLYEAQNQPAAALAQIIVLGENYYQLADMDMAVKTYSNALHLARRSGADPGSVVEIMHRIGDIDQQRLEWRQALHSYEEIKALVPADPKARESLISLNFRLGQSRQGLAELDDYLEFLRAQGQSEAGQALLEELTRMHPDEPGPHLRLANRYREQGRKKETITHLDSVAEIYLNTGKSGEAIQLIKAILALGPAESAGYQALLAKLLSAQPPKD